MTWWPTPRPYWAVHESQMDELTIPFLGPERATWQYPFRSLLAAGARLAMGSDWSVSTADPLRQIEVAVTRVSDEHRGGRAPFLPDERLTLDDALAAFTRGSAWVNHLETVLGTVEVGKTADLAVLDRDLFDRGAGRHRPGPGRGDVHRRGRRPRDAGARGLTAASAVMDA